MPGCLEEQSSGIGIASLVEGDLSAQVLDFSGSQRVRRPCIDCCHEGERHVERARVALRPSRRESAPRPRIWVRSQSRRALEECGRGQESAARPGTPCGSLQLGGDRLIG